MWNCRDLGGPSTISQLKESIRCHLPDLVFVCETKKNNQFVNTVCSRLKFQNRWISVEPNGMSGGLLDLWSERVIIHTVITSQFCVELECTNDNDLGKFWAVFVYVSTDSQLWQQQWDYLVQKKDNWGEDWFFFFGGRGDFNDIKGHDEKRGRRRRPESSFRSFRSFITSMEMEEIKAEGSEFTWANNRDGEEFVEEKLDRVFGAAS